MQKTLPKITYCVLTYNEEENIEDCLRSIFDQNYPKDKLEIIVVDDKSTDRTVEIAKKFPVKIVYNGKKDGDISATLGFHNATGEFYNAIGADMRLRGKDWFLKMVKPLIEHKEIPMSATKYYSHPKESLITKYLSLDNLQRDLVYQLFSVSMESVISDKKNGYYICNYHKDKIPPNTHGLYRISVMREIIKKQEVFYDMGNLVQLVLEGYTKFAYVPDAGFYHFHAESIKQLLGKRMRNIKRSYLRYSVKESHYKWLDFGNKIDVLKLIMLILGTNLIVPLLVFSLLRTIYYRNWLYLLDLPVTFLLVNTILLTFLKERKGRQMIIKNLLKIFQGS